MDAGVCALEDWLNEVVVEPGGLGVLEIMIVGEGSVVGEGIGPNPRRSAARYRE